MIEQYKQNSNRPESVYIGAVSQISLTIGKCIVMRTSEQTSSDEVYAQTWRLCLCV
jgi:hypothetical protein